MIRLLLRIILFVLVAYFAAEWLGDQWPWLLEHQGWLMAGAFVFAVVTR